MDKKRYKILEQIGQGGMGSVFRAFDTRMNREVAIKRIRRGDGQEAGLDEAAEQIVREAGALASLQHPHIVTVYDVGTDKDGPFVVMELINGKTIDELIERAPLTWPDFRELALQTQEALIAAQDRNLIHRDLKPSNLMLTWLPSGKFQVKIVDFGLAKLAEATTLGRLDEVDSVFGSIFFMCPEQFERAELDARADLYAMGCVYYYALTQTYPFNGETGMQVMTAHLNHEVVPLHQLRPDLHRWVCDWVMWQLNRLPADRPQDARSALKVFLHNDNSSQAKPPSPPPTQSMSTGPTQPAPDQPKRPRLIIPGAPPQGQAPPPPAPEPEPELIPEPPRTQTAPQPLSPPEGSLPSVHSSPFPEPAAAPPPPPPVAAIAPPPPPPAAVAQPVPVAKPVPASRVTVGGKPATAPVPAAGPPVGALGARPSALGGAPVGYQPQMAQAAAPVAYKKPMLSTGAKVAIAAVLGLLVVFLGLAVFGKSGSNKRTEIYNRLVEVAAKEDAKEVPVNKAELDILMNAAVDVGANMQRQTVYKALWLAKATDGTDVDLTIAEFATKQLMPDDVREVLIRDVLRKRKNPVVVPALMDFCRSTSDTRAAIAAIQACRFMSTDKEFPKYVEIVEFNNNSSIRQAAEENIGEILRKSAARETIGQRIVSAQAGAVNDEVKYSLTRLLGYVGGDKAAEVVKKSLASEDKKEQLAAAVALGSWADDTMFEALIEYMEKVTDEQLRSRVFDAGFRFLSIADRKRENEVNEDFWKMLAKSAKTRDEQMKIIRGLANNETDDWAVSVIEFFVDESQDDAVIDLAEKALDRMRERARMKSGDEADKEANKDEDKKADEKKDSEEEDKKEE